CFSERSQIWSDAKQLLRPSEAEVKTGADLVENQQRTVRVRQAFDPFQVPLTRPVEVDWLHDDRRELSPVRRQEPIERVEIIVGKGVRQLAHRRGYPSAPRGRPDVPILPPMIPGHRNPLAPADRPRDPNRA